MTTNYDEESVFGAACLNKEEAVIFYDRVDSFFNKNPEGVMDLLETIWNLSPKREVSLGLQLEDQLSQDDKIALDLAYPGENINTIFNILCRLQSALNKHAGGFTYACGCNRSRDVDLPKLYLAKEKIISDLIPESLRPIDNFNIMILNDAYSEYHHNL